MMIFLAGYLVLCLMVGLCGARRRLGFFNSFLLSIILTPVVVVVAFKLTSRSPHWKQVPPPGAEAEHA